MILPPPAFRESVFAAIRSEALRQAPSVAQISRAATNPELPVVRRPVAQAGSAPVSLERFRQFKRFDLRRVNLKVSLVAAAAVLLVSLIGVRLVSLIGSSALGGSAASLGNALQPKVARYPLGARYVLPTSALASSAWLVYTATDAAHNSMLFLENRRTRQVTPLLSAPSTATLQVRALTDRWVVWSAGDGTASAPWQLYAAALTANGPTQPITLVDTTASTPDTPATLGGVWASGNTVLVADAAQSGSGELLKIDLSSGAPVTTIIAHGQTTGDVLTDPSYDNGAYYWADVWFDSATGLHSAIWESKGAGASQEISADEAAFHPQVAHDTLVWVDVSAADLQQMSATTSGATPDSDVQMLYSLSGTLNARNLENGQQWMVSASADVPSVSVGNKLLLWHSGTRMHTYNLSGKGPLAADAQVQSATFASADGSTIVWANNATDDLFVYDAA
jgi:hypothetical protein